MITFSTGFISFLLAATIIAAFNRYNFSFKYKLVSYEELENTMLTNEQRRKLETDSLKVENERRRFKELGCQTLANNLENPHNEILVAATAPQLRIEVRTFHGFGSVLETWYKNGITNNWYKFPCGTHSGKHTENIFNNLIKVHKMDNLFTEKLLKQSNE